MTDELLGKTTSGYTIESQIGRGGMATVYLARQMSMNRVVALKVLPKNLTLDEAYYKRFEREVNIVAQLEHRAIVPVYDHGTIEGQPYIAMRYMSGGSLDQRMVTGPLRPVDVLEVYAQIAPALDYAHNKNVLHRDLKPSNVLLDETGGAFITDFGIARVIGDASHTPTITTQGVVGTPSYMSPEQAQGQPMDGRSDLYALGIMLFELLTGRRPFQSDTPYSIAVMQVTAMPPSARAINPDISPAVEQVIFKTLRKKPEERYPTAAEMVEALRIAIENPGGFNPHDTQPNRRPLSEVTQPAVPMQPMTAPTYTPPRPVSEFMPAPVAPSSASMPAAWSIRQRRQGNNNLWMSMTIGALIGCGLLTVIGFVVVIVSSQLLDRFNASDSSTSTPGTPTAAEGTAAATGDGSLVLPIGVRDPMDGQILFVSEVQLDSGIYNQIFMSGLRTPNPTQFTTSPFNHTSPAISPDGQQIAYVSDRTGSGDIYVTDFAGTRTIRVLESAASEFAPVWSADGLGLFFTSDTRGDGAHSLLYTPADGSGDVRIIYGKPNSRISHPAVSPDGLKIAFTAGLPRDASSWEITVMDLITGETANITNNAARDSYPVFSADGQMLYWVSTINGESAVWRGSLDGENTTRIYNSSDYISSLTLSPDGALLLISLGDVSQAFGALYILPITGNVDPSPLGITQASHPDWTLE